MDFDINLDKVVPGSDFDLALRRLENFEAAILAEIDIYNSNEGKIQWLERHRASRESDYRLMNHPGTIDADFPYGGFSDPIGIFYDDQFTKPVSWKICELTVAWLDRKIKELRDRSVKESKPVGLAPTFSSLFVDPKDEERCIKALRDVEPPVINDNGHYMLGERQKGAMVAFVDVLKTRNIIKVVQDDVLAAALSTKFAMSITARTLRGSRSVIYDSYKKDFTALIQK